MKRIFMYVGILAILASTAAINAKAIRQNEEVNEAYLLSSESYGKTNTQVESANDEPSLLSRNGKGSRI